MRLPVVLSSVILALALVASCGAEADPSTTGKAPPSGSPSPSADAPRAEQRVHEQSGPYDLTLEQVSVVCRDGHDRVVLRFAGTGRPGWAVRFVDEAVLDGSGDVVKVGGDAILQLDISGTPTLDPGIGEPVRRELGGDVVDLHTARAHEGVTQVFLGLRGGRTPFRVVALTEPSRLVVDVT